MNTITPPLFDTHTHITKCTTLNPTEYLAIASDSNVRYMLDAGIWPNDFEARHNALHSFGNVLLGIAAAPHHAEDYNQSTLDTIEELLYRYPKKIAIIGEIGLEYFHPGDRQVQKEMFANQLQIANRFSLPVALHIREGFDDAYEIIQANQPTTSNISGILHCFTGSIEQAKRFLDRNYMISFAGMVTFPNNQALREVVAYVPTERIVIETDSPYLAPVPFRGKPNNSSYLKYIVETIAKIKNAEIDVISEQIYSNSLKIFPNIAF